MKNKSQTMKQIYNIQLVFERFFSLNLQMEILKNKLEVIVDSISHYFLNCKRRMTMKNQKSKKNKDHSKKSGTKLKSIWFDFQSTKKQTK